MCLLLIASAASAASNASGAGRDWNASPRVAAEKQKSFWEEPKNLEPLFDAIVKTTPEPQGDIGGPLQILVANLDYSDYLGRLAIARVFNGTMRTGEDVVVKVQRPQVTRLVQLDLQAMAWLAPHLVGRIPIASLANPPALVELFAETVLPLLRG